MISSIIMELPADVWKEILKYTDSSMDGKIKEMNTIVLMDNELKFHREIANRMCIVKSKIKCYDIVKIKRILCPALDAKFGMVVSKANDRQNHKTIKVITMERCDKNTQFGYFRPVNRNYISISAVYLPEVSIEIVKSTYETISANKLIGSKLKINDVIEFTGALFTSGCDFGCIHYAMVKEIRSYNTIVIQLIKDYWGNIQDVDYEDLSVVLDVSVVFDECRAINTKNILKHIQLDDVNDENDYYINPLKHIIKHKILHRNQFVNVLQAINSKN